MAAAKFNMLIAAKTAGTAGIKRMGNSMQGLQGRLKNVRLAALSVNTAFKAMALILTAGTFTRFVTGAINQADAFGKLSRQTGVAADQLQAYVNAGKLAGVEQSTIEKGLRRLAQSQREADQGIKTYSESYEALGISVRDADGNLKSSEVLLADISDRFRDMPDGATKAALAMEIFGRSGAQLIPMLNEGGEALDKWNYETSEGFAANAEYFNDQITMLGFGFDGFRKQLADALLPTLNTVVNVFSELFSADNDFSGFFKAIEIGIRGISIGIFATIKLVDEMIRIIGQLAKRVKSFVDGVIKSIPKWMINLLGGAGKGLANIGGGIQNNLTSGLKGIFGQDFTEGFTERFTESFEKINKLFSGTKNAPAEYFKEGTIEAKALSTQITKTFGDQMKSKIQKFNESIKTVGESMSDVVISGVKKMEDSLLDFVTTGKLNFKDLANSIIKDMARIAIQQTFTKNITSFLGGFFGGGKAMGGPVGANKSYLVGENGPEILRMGNQSGSITPNHRLGGMGSTSVVVNVDASGGSEVQGDEGQARLLGKVVATAVKNQIANERRPGGLLYA